MSDGQQEGFKTPALRSVRVEPALGPMIRIDRVPTNNLFAPLVNLRMSVADASSLRDDLDDAIREAIGA